MDKSYIKFIIAYDYADKLEELELACDEAYELAEKIADEYDEYTRVFEVPTEKELEKLKRYLYLKATEGMSIYRDGKWYNNYCDSASLNRVDLSGLTYGHKIITFWSYEDDCCWMYGDGSLEAYANYAKERMEKAITKAYSDNKED